ncbi:MAG: hypothetical protein ACI9HK_000765, partial [Pirellulaceae bacterium]
RFDKKRLAMKIEMQWEKPADETIFFYPIRNVAYSFTRRSSK